MAIVLLELTSATGLGRAKYSLVARAVVCKVIVFLLSRACRKNKISFKNFGYKRISFKSLNISRNQEEKYSRKYDRIVNNYLCRELGTQRQVSLRHNGAVHTR